MSKIIKFFEKLLFPPNIKCVVCGDDLSYDAKYCICDKCAKTLPYITGKSCNKCGAESIVNITAAITKQIIFFISHLSISVFLYPFR